MQFFAGEQSKIAITVHDTFFFLLWIFASLQIEHGILLVNVFIVCMHSAHILHTRHGIL